MSVSVLSPSGEPIMGGDKMEADMVDYVDNHIGAVIVDDHTGQVVYP